MRIRTCARLLLLLAATSGWAQSQSAQVVDDRLQGPDGPSSVRKAGGASRTRGSLSTDAKHDRESRRAQKGKRHSGVARPPAVLVEEPKPEAPPSPPPTPAQMPANAPQVTYRNGLLTVTANNSTLGDILNLVRSKTGASIEYPASLSQERVAAIVGPAPAPQVLATLLNGTRFDYILLGTDGRPDLLQRAIITPRETSGAVSAAATPPPTRGAVPPPSPAEEEPNMPPDETVEQQEEPAPPQAQPMQPQPGMQVPPNQPFPQQPAPVDQQQPGQSQQPKTPEQLLQELQRMQQQQQQQQQQQPPQQ